MADNRIVSEIVTEFFLSTCQLRQQLNEYSVQALTDCVQFTIKRSFDDNKAVCIPLITGSVAEFYIRPMFSCVGDADVMFHFNSQLAIQAGTAPPTQLPAEFHRHVTVHEIIDSDFPGYVYLVRSYLITECIDSGKYNAEQCRRRYTSYGIAHAAGDRLHGPAIFSQFSRHLLPHPGRIAGSAYFTDLVPCVRCLSWPLQAADWASRHREYGWPDSATVDRVVSYRCDVVNVAHRQCKQDEWMSKYQWRLSFSRAEVILLNSWMPV